MTNKEFQSFLSHTGLTPDEQSLLEQFAILQGEQSLLKEGLESWSKEELAESTAEKRTQIVQSFEREMMDGCKSATYLSDLLVGKMILSPIQAENLNY